MSRSRVTVFGAGRVAAPALEYLLRRYQVTLVDADTGALARQQERAADSNLTTHVADVASSAAMSFIEGSVCVLSLLPPEMHLAVAKACLRAKVPFVTTSYTSEEMRALHDDVVAAGVPFVNECGLDPGIDHMLAMRSIDAVHREGGRVRSFVSQCGGIPADRSVNPLGYKMSWSPAGVIAAARKGARYLEAAEMKELPPEAVFAGAARVQVPGVGELEAFYNRDSLLFADVYGVTGEVERFARMTLRYPGWCDTLGALYRLGALNEEPLRPGALALEILGTAPAETTPRGSVAARLGLSVDAAVLDRLEWLGLFSRELVEGSVGTKAQAVVGRMSRLLQYNDGEMDRVVLRHEIKSEYLGGLAETETALLVVDGASGGDSAMARSVGVPAAAAVTLLADRSFDEPGVHIPILASLYDPILNILASEKLAPVVTRQRPKRM